MPKRRFSLSVDGMVSHAAEATLPRLSGVRLNAKEIPSGLDEQSRERMKKLLFVLCLVAWNAWAATYYVDTTAGSNGEGSLGSPWNALTNILTATIAPADTVCIKGATTGAGWTVPEAGTSGNLLTYDFGCSSWGSGTISATSGTAAVLANKGFTVVKNGNFQLCIEAESGGAAQTENYNDFFCTTRANYNGVGWSNGTNTITTDLKLYGGASPNSSNEAKPDCTQSPLRRAGTWLASYRDYGNRAFANPPTIGAWECASGDSRSTVTARWW